ncbi:SET domain protein [Melanogaster broomeanus]|nr:SET domain protein [Melanogaster broomeanus]
MALVGHVYYLSSVSLLPASLYAHILTMTNDATGTHPPPQKSPDPSFRSVLIVRIKSISDPAHPARGQYGLFALKTIKPRTHIIDYIGEVHCQERLTSDYDLSLCRSQDGINVGIDASAMGNEARFVNDYRGIQGKPNAEFVEYRTAAGELRMSIWSTGDSIKKGNEILVSYGKSWWRSRVGDTTPHMADLPPNLSEVIQS